MTVVVDASLVVAALVDSGRDGRWAEEIVATNTLAAPHLMPVEVANVLRRASAAGLISVDTASLALRDLVDLDLHLFPFAPFVDRIWELRENLTSYDAWYVAMAEILDFGLATLDLKIRRATGPRCAFLTPPR